MELAKKDAELQLAKKDAELGLAMAKKDAELELVKKGAELAKKDSELELAKKEAQLVTKGIEVELAKKDGELRLHYTKLAAETLRADVYRGVLSIRALVETAAKQMAPLVGLQPTAGVTDILERAFSSKPPIRCASFHAYMEVCAADNHVALDQLLRDGRELYNLMSKRMHSDVVSHPSDRLDSELFNGQKTVLLALASLAAFNGRDLRLYEGGTMVSGATSSPLRIRVTPVRGGQATKAEIEGLATIIAE